ncbi:transposase family protein [Streptomyces sp. NPDC004232]|uniref:transposase family protein n=1 Tax=Streptomyces sp. NPDC004232 TaxID=3154454 RepID=UPI001D79CB50|nr:IS5/IS1182 family transposase [Streptomyces sp. tea 10]
MAGWRSRSAGQIAVLVPAVVRHDQRAAYLAGGNDISVTTIRRWCDVAIALLAAKAPRRDRALKKIARGGGDVVPLDGTLIRTRRRTAKANRKNYSGKHKSHGLLFLALTDERGNLARTSSARRDAAGEVKTARHDKICEHLRIAGLGALADLGLVGLDQDPNDPVITTGVKQTRKKKLTTAQKQNNQLIAATRAPVEHGFAALKDWRILTRLRLDPARATNLLRVLLVLTNLETSR